MKDDFELETERRIKKLREDRARRRNPEPEIIEVEKNITSPSVASIASRILKDLRNGKLDTTTVEEIKSVAASVLRQSRRRNSGEKNDY